MRFAAAVAVMALLATGTAAAALSNQRTVTQGAVATATLQPPTGLVADCNALLGAGSVRLDWTPTASTFAVGYVIQRRLNSGAFVDQATVTPRTLATWTQSLGLLSNLLGATLTYRLVSYRGAWTSVPSATATVTISLLGAC